MMRFAHSASLAVLAVLLAAPGAWAEPPGGAACRVFYTGHSFSGGPHEWMWILCQQAGVEGYESLGRQMAGASRVVTHWNIADERNRAKQALQQGSVDVLVLSPNMQMPDEGIDAFVELALKHNPPVRILVQGSWLTWDGLGPQGITNTQRDERPVAEIRDRTARHMEEIREQLRSVNRRVGRDLCTLVPVGAGVVRLRELVAEGKLPGFERPAQLFSDDIGHASPAVSHLATYMFYIALFQKDPRPLPGLGSNNWTKKWGTPPKELAPLLKTVAWEVMQGEPLSGLPKE
jgi:hypothetical protein